MIMHKPPIFHFWLWWCLAAQTPENNNDINQGGYGQQGPWFCHVPRGARRDVPQTDGRPQVFTFTLPLSQVNFHFHTFTLPLSQVHCHTSTLSFSQVHFHFHKFTFTLSHFTRGAGRDVPQTDKRPEVWSLILSPEIIINLWFALIIKDTNQRSSEERGWNDSPESRCIDSFTTECLEAGL